MKAHLTKVMASRDDVPQTQGFLWSAERWITERALFGAKHHTLLAGVHTDTDDLVALAVPCRLLYDRSQGGRVEGPILDRHPKSIGRTKAVDTPTEMPDLAPSELRPMDARWVAGFTPWGGVSPYDIFRGWTDEAHRLFPRYPEGLLIAGDDFKPHNAPCLPKRLAKGGLDGRDAIALINANELGGTSVVLRRRIERSATHWTLVASIEALELFRRRRLEASTVPDLAAAAALILAVDVERMLRRSVEAGERPAVVLEFGASQRTMLPRSVMLPGRSLKGVSSESSRLAGPAHRQPFSEVASTAGRQRPTNVGRVPSCSRPTTSPLARPRRIFCQRGHLYFAGRGHLNLGLKCGSILPHD